MKCIRNNADLNIFKSFITVLQNFANYIRTKRNRFVNA